MYLLVWSLFDQFIRTQKADEIPPSRKTVKTVQYLRNTIPPPTWQFLPSDPPKVVTF